MTASTTKSRGIIFSAPMVRALLEGLKTQTRRIVKPMPQHWQSIYTFDDGTFSRIGDYYESNPFTCPYGNVGNELYVKEAFALTPEQGEGEGEGIFYRADWRDTEPWTLSWRSPRFMPRWASRISLRIKAIRVERLTPISTKEVLAEGFDQGVDEGDYMAARAAFKETWQKLHSKPGERWADNPWVWVISFSIIGGKDARPASEQQ